MRAFGLMLLLPSLLLLAPPAAADELHSTYVTADDVQLQRVLPPPPPPDSEDGQAELAAVESAVVSRTLDDEKRISAQIPCNAIAFARDIMGPNFTSARVPVTIAVIDRAFADTELAVLAAKKAIGRKRPYTLEPRLNTFGHRSDSASYPSGHAACGRVMAVILAAMVPEKAQALYARAELYGVNRLIAGTHFPSDLAAGATSGAVVGDALFRNDRFQADFAQARTETRAALKLKK